jgi:hypothetical protein
MKLKVGDFVVLTERGKEFFGIPRSELSPVYSISLICNAEKMCIHGLELSVRNKNENFMISSHYREATEKEIKVCKIKNMFD